VETPFSTTSVPHEEPVQEHMCEAVGSWTYNNEVTLTCNDPDARIDYIWADMGLEPTGQCGTFVPNVNCSNHNLATVWANAECLGRHTCTLRKASETVSSFVVCPIAILIKKTVEPFTQQLTVQARCTGTKGGHTSAEYTGHSIFSVGFVSPDKKSKKLLLVNKEAHPIDVKISGSDLAHGDVTLYIVDPRSVSRSSAQGIRVEKWKPGLFTESSFVVTLQPFAVAVAIMGEDNSANAASVLI